VRWSGLRLSPDTLRLLDQKGHEIVTGAADPRQRGTLTEGF
jgi:hypothetical protein